MLQLDPQPIALKPRYEDCVVGAVDTSSMKIGETATGMLLAVRGATVWKQKANYHYMRFGPFIFHVTEENKRQVYDTLQMAYFSTLGEDNHRSLPNLIQMPMRIANLLERWLQMMLSKTMNDGLLLFDGSLTSGTIDTPTQSLKGILSIGRKRGNTVLAFSKITNLRINGHLITDMLPEHKPPYLLKVYGLRTKPPVVLLGDLYVAKLGKEKYAFRLDIDREVAPPQRTEAVEKLLGNELILQGYPETLRLAHILCTFTANEVIAMQHFATREHGFQIINRPDMHRLLFGSFGKGEANS
jgi:hypothetical protein